MLTAVLIWLLVSQEPLLDPTDVTPVGPHSAPPNIASPMKSCCSCLVEASQDNPVHGAQEESEYQAVYRALVRKHLRSVRGKEKASLVFQNLEQLDVKEGIPAIIGCLRDASPLTRVEAAELLRELRVKEAIPELTKLLGDPEASVRHRVTSILADLGATSAIALLIECLKDKEGIVRCWSAGALSDMGAKEAIPALVGLLKDPEYYVRGHAANALAYLDARESVRDILPLLNDPEDWVRLFSSGALANMGASEAIPEIAKLLDDRSGWVRGWVAVDLAKLGAKDSLPRIEKLLKDQHTEARSHAIEALARLRGQEAVASILPFLQDPSIQMAALDSLMKLKARTAAPEVIKLLKSDYWGTVHRAGEWLCRLGFREGVPAVLDHAFFGCWTLNGVRQIEICEKLDGIKVTGKHLGRPKEILAVLARQAGMRLEWSDKLKVVDHPRLAELTRVGDHGEGTTLLRALSYLNHDGIEIILERDQIRALSADEGLKFWKAWYESLPELKDKK